VNLIPAARWICLALSVFALAGCRAAPNPELAYAQVRQTFIHGDLLASQEEAERGYHQFAALSPNWALKFRILEAESLMWRGMSREALNILTGLSSPADTPATISILTLQGLAYARMHQFSAAESSFHHAEDLCAAPQMSCGPVLRARGVLALEEGHAEEAHKYFERTSAIAQASGDTFLDATAHLNLSLRLSSKSILTKR
jgi:tetratricopeptide (TPR) repeat protein